MPRATPSVRLERAIAGALAAVLLASAFTVVAQPTRAANWSAQIAATRGGQLASEAAMLSADRQIRSLKHALRQNRRKLRSQRRASARVAERRDEARARLASSRERLHVARLGLEEATESLTFAETHDEVPWSLGPGAAATLSLLEESDEAMSSVLPRSPVIHRSPLIPRPPESPLISGALVEDRDLGLPLPGGGTAASIEMRRAHVRGLEQTVKQQERRLRSLQRKTRRMERRERARIRAIGSMKARSRAALSYRAGAEAALASRIVAMSHLAVRRATKKTNVRPGRNTPFVWPARGRISQRYGCTGSIYSPRRGSCPHFHDGVDIVAGHGSPIRAAGVGVVSYVGRNPWDRGKRAFMVVVAHPGGYETLYGHVLPIRRVRVGQLVHKGQVIAYMGSTGHSTGTHLHLELRRGYTTLDPLAFL